MRAIVVAILLAAVLVSPAYAAITLQPGEWQDTTTGTEDGKPVAPEVEKSCLSPEEARDASNVVRKMKEEMQSGAGQCQKFDVQESGNTVTFAMKCGDASAKFLMEMAGTFNFISATRYQGTFKSTMMMGGKPIVQDKKIESVRVGNCPK